MQILRLKLCNLASLAGEQEIDFQQQPLKSAGLIAITGRTGAGKSTLLDAMCLALYDQIPRFKGSIHGTTDDFSKSSDTRQILTRGTGFGYAELEFIGIDQKRYISRTEMSRVRKKATEKLKANSRSLICVDDDYRVLATKTKECEQLIVEKTGLNFEQFTRAVLLAQSEVSAFLKAKDDERAQLLEHLTGSHIFKKIGQMAYEQQKNAKSAYEQAQQLTGMVELLAPEEFQQKQEQYQQVKTKIQQLQQQIEQINQQQKQYLDYQQLQAEQHDYQQQLIDLKQQNIEQQQQRLNELQAYQHIAGEWQLWQASALTIQRLHGEIAQVQQHINTHQQSLQQAQFAYQQAVVQQQQLQPALEQQLIDIDVVLDKHQRMEQLRADFKQKRQELTLLTEKQADDERQLQQLNQQYIAGQQQQQDYEKNIQSLNYLQQEPSAFLALLTEYQQYNKKFVKLLAQQDEKLTSPVDWWQSYQQLQQNLHEFQQKHESLERLQQQQTQYYQQMSQCNQQRQALQTVLQQWQSLEKEQQQLATLKQQVDELIQHLQQEQHLEQQRQQDYQLREQQWQTAWDILQQQKLIHSQDVKYLRSQLQEHQPCMVCGSEHHPWRENLQQNLLALQQQQEQDYAQQKQQAWDLWQQQQQQRLAIQHQLQNSQHNLQQLEQLYQQHQAEFNIKIQQDELFLFDGNVLNQQQIYKHIIQKLDENQYQLQKVEQDLSQLEGIIEQYHRLQNKLNREHELEQQYRILQMIDDKIVHKLSSEYQSQWKNQHLACIEQWSADLQQQIDYEQKLAELQLKQTDVLKQQHLLQQKNEYYQKDKEKLQQLMEQVKQQGQQLKTENEQIFSKYQREDQQELEKPLLWKQRILADVEQLKIHVQQSLQSQQQAEHQYEKYQQHLQLLEQQLVEHQQQQQVSRIKINQWQQHHKFDDGWLIQLSQNHQIHDELILLKQTVEQHIQHLTTVHSKLELIQQKMQAIDIKELGDFAELTSIIQQLHDEQTQYQQQCDELGSILKLQQSQQEKYQIYQQQFIQAEQEYMRWNRIHQLIGIRDGGEFQRIAQQYYLDILLQYANYQLAQLTQRYELCRINESLSLSIIDHDMNDEQRGVLSLSGGESFLVSLSLALGIAHMASHHLKLETLFIDEGFGTLDQESLHIVMDTLDRLQGQGRKVILISHIQEIHERIPVQIKVATCGEGKSKLNIV